MTTIHEFSVDDVSFDAFCKEREEARERAIARVLEIRKETEKRLAALHEQEEAIFAEMAPSSTPLGQRLKARRSAKRARHEAEHEIHMTLGAQERELRRSWNIGSPAKALAQTMDDFAHAVHESQDRPTLDPVLMAIPGSRVKDDRGWRVYSKRTALRGSVEMCRVLGDSIVVRGSDEDRVRAALLLAKDRLVPPLRFNGSDAFVSTANRLAEEMGLTAGSQANTIGGTQAPETPAQATSTSATTNTVASQPSSSAPTPGPVSDEQARANEPLEVAAPEPSAHPSARDLFSEEIAVNADRLFLDATPIEGNPIEPMDCEGVVLGVRDAQSGRIALLDTGAALVAVDVPAGADLTGQVRWERDAAGGVMVAPSTQDGTVPANDKVAREGESAAQKPATANRRRRRRSRGGA